MVNVSFSLLLSIFIGFVSLGVYLYCGQRQVYEVLLPQDWLTRLRVIVLLVLVVSITSSLPGMAYNIMRLYGLDNEPLRNVAVVTSNLSRLAGAVLLLLVYTYKKKD